MKKTLPAFLIVITGLGIGLFFGATQEIHSLINIPEAGIELPIVISDIAELDELEERRVHFYHAKHVRALEKEGCGTCHPHNTDGTFLFTYPRERVETSRRALMDSYHDSCIGCHDRRLAEGTNSGPTACGECHAPKTEQPWMQPAGFDYSLHYKHATSMDQQCGTCHHIYDEKEKQLIYQKGVESSCRDCHRDNSLPDMPSFRKVAHSGCVNCHMKKEEIGEKTGPATCIGCHGEKERISIEALANIPRPDRNQAEKIFLEDVNGSMQGVSFNHTLHEYTTKTCRACHHETLSACNQCHTSEGDVQGDGITLMDAFHKQTSLRSCIGCHNAMKEDALCAGCHDSMKDTSMSENNCSTCHTGSPERAHHTENMNHGDDLVSALPDDDIMIDVLENSYEPAKLPHSMIIRKLLDSSHNNKLANTFHQDELTMCRGCHHYSSTEPENQPPLCRSCHTIDFDPEDLGKPRLIAAYHLQCMGCHEKMNLCTDCTSCHAQKGSTSTTSQKTADQ